MFILPINRDDYEGQRPYVLIALAGVNLLVLAWTYLLATPAEVFKQYGFIPVEPHFRTAVMSMFLHAGIAHYLGNFFFLWMFGYRVENAFGRLVFLTVYLSCGLGAVLTHYIFNSDATIPCVGASGAISGIAGCYFVLFPKSLFDIEVYFGRFHVTSIPTTTTGALGAWMAEQIALGLISTVVSFSSTAFLAHVGGFGMGVVLAAFLVKVSPEIRVRGESIRTAQRSRSERKLPFVEQLHARILAPSPAGTVVDEKNLPIGDVRVIEVSRDWNSELQSTVSDARGKWALAAHATDSVYRLHFVKQGYKDVRVRLKVRPRFEHSARINLRPQSVDASSKAAAAAVS